MECGRTEFNGTAWTEINDIATARALGGGSGGLNQTGIMQVDNTQIPPYSKCDRRMDSRRFSN